MTFNESLQIKIALRPHVLSNQSFLQLLVLKCSRAQVSPQLSVNVCTSIKTTLQSSDVHQATLPFTYIYPHKARAKFVHQDAFNMRLQLPVVPPNSPPQPRDQLQDLLYPLLLLPKACSTGQNLTSHTPLRTQWESRFSALLFFRCRPWPTSPSLLQILNMWLLLIESLMFSWQFDQKQVKVNEDWFSSFGPPLCPLSVCVLVPAQFHQRQQSNRAD